MHFRKCLQLYNLVGKYVSVFNLYFKENIVTVIISGLGKDDILNLINKNMEYIFISNKPVNTFKNPVFGINKMYTYKHTHTHTPNRLLFSLKNEGNSSMLQHG